MRVGNQYLLDLRVGTQKTEVSMYSVLMGWWCGCETDTATRAGPWEHGSRSLWKWKYHDELAVADRIEQDRAGCVRAMEQEFVSQTFLCCCGIGGML